MLNNKVHFKVKWENYSDKESTWEPLENLRNCIVLINFIDNVFNYLKNEIKNTNIKLFQSEINIEDMECKHLENNIFQNLESTTNDLDLKCLQIVYNLMIQKGINPSENFTLFYMEEFKLSRLKMHLICLRNLFTSIEDKFLLTVENTVDFELPPPFQYITKKIISKDLIINNTIRTQY